MLNLLFDQQIELNALAGSTLRRWCGDVLEAPPRTATLFAALEIATGDPLRGSTPVCTL